MGEMKGKYIQVQISALHFVFFKVMCVLGNTFIPLCLRFKKHLLLKWPDSLTY